MDLQRLSKLIETPEFHRQLLGSYAGAYSIGITADPAEPSRPAVRVRVQGATPPAIPSALVIDGETVPVIVHSQFVPPAPLPARANAT
jgi:hypothetical protein